MRVAFVSLSVYACPPVMVTTKYLTLPNGERLFFDTPELTAVAKRDPMHIHASVSLSPPFSLYLSLSLCLSLIPSLSSSTARCGDNARNVLCRSNCSCVSVYKMFCLAVFDFVVQSRVQASVLLFDVFRMSRVDCSPRQRGCVPPMLVFALGV